MRKFLATLIIAILFAGAIFAIGWIQLYIPAGRYGVITTKTGGTDLRVIAPGEFCWRWERLLPMNTILRSFDLAPMSRESSISGELPSANVYKNMLEGNPDFSYKVSFSFNVSLNGGALPRVVRDYKIEDQSQLETWLDSQANQVLQRVTASIFQEIERDPAQLYDEQNAALKRIIENAITAGDIKFKDFYITEIKIPDIAMYAAAREAYLEYQRRKQNAVIEAAAVQAGAAAVEWLQIERFQKWGEVLSQYPILIDFLAAANTDAQGAFEAVRSLRAQQEQ